MELSQKLTLILLIFDDLSKLFDFFGGSFVGFKIIGNRQSQKKTLFHQIEKFMLITFHILDP
jgi:hypothetical protein